MSTIRVTLCFSFLQLFLWVGKDANAEEKTGAPKIGLLHENLTGKKNEALRPNCFASDTFSIYY